MTSISIQIQSVGFSFGNCASITINGSDVAPGQYQRGLNVAVADQSTGALRWFHNYDTNASSEAAGAGGATGPGSNGSAGALGSGGAGGGGGAKGGGGGGGLLSSIAVPTNGSVNAGAFQPSSCPFCLSQFRLVVTGPWGSVSQTILNQ